MNSLKAVLFDLDGTLLDSKKSVLEAVYYTSNKFRPGKYSYQEIEKRFGESMEEFIKLLGEERKKEILITYMEYITRNHDELVSLFPGVKESLSRLRKNDYRLAVITNKQKNLTLKGLELFNISGMFDTLVTVDDVKKGKPAPEPVERACIELGVDKGNVIMVGDTIFDVEAACRADVKSAVIDWYGNYPLRQLKPDYFYTSLTDFTDQLCKYREVL